MVTQSYLGDIRNPFCIWKCFGTIFRLPYSFQSIAQLLHIWMPTAGPLSQYDFYRGGTEAFILWETWVSRCAATYDGIAMGARRICKRIISQVQLLSSICSPKKPSTTFQNNTLGILGIRPRSPHVKMGRWCQWQRPNSDVDGSARNDHWWRPHT